MTTTTETSAAALAAFRLASRVRAATTALDGRLTGFSPRYALTVFAVAAHGRAITSAELASVTGTTARTAGRIADELVGLGWLSRFEQPAGTSRYELPAGWLTVVARGVESLEASS